MKDDRIEFRCSTALKDQLDQATHILGCRNRSDAARLLIEAALSQTSQNEVLGRSQLVKELMLVMERQIGALQMMRLRAIRGQAIDDLQETLACVRRTQVDIRKTVCRNG